MARQTTKLTKSDDDLRSAFLSAKTTQEVADLLEVPLKTLTFYAFKKQNYGDFLLQRACGRPRVISVPVTPLKIIQSKLAQVLYAVYGSRSVVHGFARGKSIKSNAARHVGAEWILNFDLKDFFPTIHFGRVLGLFSGRPYNKQPDVSLLLARICCHNGGLPIGAPTSPIAANMICAKMDSELKALAWSCGCIYTRYADDISISTKSVVFDKRIAEKSLGKRQWELGAELSDVIKRNSFEINPAKTRVRGRQSSQEITGIRINERLNVNRQLLRQVRSMLHAWEKFGENAAQNEYWSKYDHKQRAKERPPYRAVLRGKIEFIGFIRGRDDRLYVSLLQRLQRLGALKAKPIIVGPSTHEAVIRQAIWLLEDQNHENQGTAFAVEGNRLLTAAHNTNHFLLASRPSFDPGNLYRVTLVKREDDLDIAEIKISEPLPVQLAFAPPAAITLMKPICVAGFPNYHIGDSVGFRFGRIVQERFYLGVKQSVKHFIVDADIVKGNSGGPVMAEDNRVIGIAVKGLDAPGTLDRNDHLSSFVPVDASSI